MGLDVDNIYFVLQTKFLVTSMLHTYNRAAFAAGTINTNGLLSLYCSLVVLELALKDHLHQTSGRWETGHRIIYWLNELGETSLSIQLATKLSALYCTSRNGTEVSIRPDQYPDIRYLRHESDFPGKSTDTQIQEALDIITDIRRMLIAIGVNL